MDLHRGRLVVDRTAAHGPEEIGEGNVDARSGLAVPEDFEDESRIEFAAGVIGDVPVGYLARPFQVAQYDLLARGNPHLVVFNVRIGNGILDTV